MMDEKEMLNDEPANDELMNDEESDTYEDESDNREKMRKSYSRYGLKLVIFTVVASALQVFGSTILAGLLGINPNESSWYSFVNILVPMHIIGLGLMLLLTKKDEKLVPEKHSMKFGQFILTIFLMAGMIGVGAVVGFILNALLMLPFGVQLQNSSIIANLMLDSNPFWRILVVGITAPICEELIFRKLIIDRTYRYGEWVAILTSGLMFGLYHANLQQFFFTTLMGGLLAYVYIRTGKIWYTVIMHALVNLTTSVITLALTQNYMSVGVDKITEYEELSMAYLESQSQEAMDRMMEVASEVVPQMVPYYLWMGFLGNICMVGIVLWIIFLVKKKFTIKRSVDYVEGGMKYAWINIGMLLFLGACVFLAVSNFLTVIKMSQ